MEVIPRGLVVHLHGLYASLFSRIAGNLASGEV